MVQLSDSEGMQSADDGELEALSPARKKSMLSGLLTTLANYLLRDEDNDENNDDLEDI